jgi:ATP-dependent Lon protease
VILPKKNEKDLRDIPDEIRKQIKVVLVDSMDQVLDAALRRHPQPLQRRSPETGGGEKKGEPLAVPTRSGFPADQPAAIASSR